MPETKPKVKRPVHEIIADKIDYLEKQLDDKLSKDLKRHRINGGGQIAFVKLTTEFSEAIDSLKDVRFYLLSNPDPQPAPSDDNDD